MVLKLNQFIDGCMEILKLVNSIPSQRSLITNKGANNVKFNFIKLSLIILSIVSALLLRLDSSLDFNYVSSVVNDYSFYSFTVLGTHLLLLVIILLSTYYLFTIVNTTIYRLNYLIKFNSNLINNIKKQQSLKMKLINILIYTLYILKTIFFIALSLLICINMLTLKSIGFIYIFPVLFAIVYAIQSFNNYSENFIMNKNISTWLLLFTGFYTLVICIVFPSCFKDFIINVENKYNINALQKNVILSAQESSVPGPDEISDISDTSNTENDLRLSNLKTDRDLAMRVVELRVYEDSELSNDNILKAINEDITISTNESIEPNSNLTPTKSESFELLANYLENSENSSSIRKDFPWFYDMNGKAIDYLQPIKLFKGVELVSDYIRQRFLVSKENISEEKLTKILEPFQDGKEVTILEFFEHINRIYAKDNSFFTKDTVVKEPETTETELVSQSSTKAVTENLLGSLGKKTLDEVFIAIRDSNWPLILHNTKFTVHIVPTAVSLVSYSLILKSYIKIIHNRPYPTNVTGTAKLSLIKERRLQLASFVLLGAPLFYTTMCKFGTLGKDLITVDVDFNKWGNSNSANSSGISLDGNSNINSSVLSGLFIKIFKIPFYIKYVVGLLLANLIILKLLGFSIFIETGLNLQYLIAFSLLGSVLTILINILKLYTVHIFVNKNRDVPEIFPNWIKNWISELKTLGLKAENLKYMTDMYYREIVLYTIIIIFTIFIY